MPQSYAGVFIHIIFRTKDRYTLIPESLFDEIGSYIGGICRNEKCKLISSGGMSDHLHLLLSLDREHSISNIVKIIKASSSKWIHEKDNHFRSFSWQAGYGAFSVSPSVIESVKKYIANQKEHHRHRSYREEVIDFLRNYGVEYEDKWLPEEGE